MKEAVLFAVIGSSALPIGALIAYWRPPSRAVTAALLGFASGALITAVAFELFEDAFERGGAWRAGIAFLGGATAFIVVDVWLERRTRRERARGGAVGLALLAGVTLDGVPENIALGVSIVAPGSSAALLVAIFASNLPEAIVGAEKMREAHRSERNILLIWTATAVLLAAAVVIGYLSLETLSESALVWPLGFAAGAVLASLADTLMPEAFAEGGPPVAYATALGFLSTFMIAAA